MTRRIGLFGGTFDPPHIGHCIIANEVLKRCQLDEVWWIPTSTPPHKNKSNAVSDEARSQMVKLICEENESFHFCGIELERSGKSYTVDTLLSLKKMHLDASFSFLIGGDMIAYLPKWHRIEELVKLVEFIGVEREGYSTHSPYEFTKVEVPSMAVSSSMIRSKLNNGENVRYLVPDNVWNWIRKEGLYGTS